MNVFRCPTARIRRLMPHESVAVCAVAALGALLSLLSAHDLRAQTPLDEEVTTPLYSSHRGSVSVVPKITPDTPSSTRIGMIDADTRWQFVTREEIEVSRSIIRLSDVIRPLESDLVAWQRLADASIGLMPVDGSDAKISRDRLADLISRATATPGRIKIYGPETIVVRRSYVSSTADANSPANVYPSGNSGTPTIVRTGFASPGESVATALHDSAETRHAPDPPIDPLVEERLRQYVLAMIRNQYRALLEGFEIGIEFDTKQADMLGDIQGIRHLTFPDGVPVWSNEMTETIVAEARLYGRADREDVQGTVRLKLTPHPGVVTARQSMRRGQRVTRGDLQYEPYSADGISLPEDVVRYPDDIVGMEVVGLVRNNVPLSFGAFAAPRVIRRGDLLEVQVGGGGIRVTTGAKALGDGAIGELIEIETISPKRRLLAKVVNSSLVEIMTQAPHVRSERAASSNQTAGR
ncbi:MAG: flagellar basal body P-ring formation chaperone FlgA [Rhodopirellula sp. JB044]|uniref:flagellar basal body P-ring formation chaperone FlgA n=1 Tax=Rhodopirellula sp. JB044 TaxID=3342844 RepID=UPI00370B000D